MLNIKENFAKNKLYYLVALGLIAVSSMVVLFSSGPGGIFKGFIGEELTMPDTATVECLDTTYTGAEYNALSQDQKADCFIDMIVSQLGESTCETLDAYFSSTLPGTQMSTEHNTFQDPKTKLLIESIYGVYAEKSCSGTPFISQYTAEEAAHIGDYCLPSSIYVDRGILEELAPDADFGDMQGEISMCLPLIFPDQASSDTFGNYVFSAISDQINITDCSVLQSLKTNENNRYKILESTKQILEQRMAQYCSCEEEGYEPNPLNPSECIYSCEQTLNSAEMDNGNYQLALQTNMEETARINRLNDLVESVTAANTNSCFTQPDIQDQCNQLSLYRNAIGITQRERTLIDDLGETIGCAFGPGMIIGANGTIQIDAEELANDFVTQVSLYDYALKRNSSAEDQAMKKSVLINALSLFATYPNYLEKLEDIQNKPATCDSILNILNSGELEYGDNADSETEMLANTSKYLQCCAAPGYYNNVAETELGNEDALYACTAAPEDLRNEVNEKPFCSEVDSEFADTASEIADIIYGAFGQAVEFKDEAQLIESIDSIKLLATDFDKDICKIDSPLCTQANQQLIDGDYLADEFSEESKQKLSSLMNQTLDCCLLEGTPSYIFDVYAQDPASRKCKPAPNKIPEFTQVIVDQSFNPTENQRGKFSYSLDSFGDVKIEISDNTGQQVYLSYDADVTADTFTHSFWDGTNNDGNSLSEGQYTYKLTPSSSLGTGDSRTGIIAISGQPDDPDTPDTPGEQDGLIITVEPTAESFNPREGESFYLTLASNQLAFTQVKFYSRANGEDTLILEKEQTSITEGQRNRWEWDGKPEGSDEYMPDGEYVYKVYSFNSAYSPESGVLQAQGTFRIESADTPDVDTVLSVDPTAQSFNPSGGELFTVSFTPTLDIELGVRFYKRTANAEDELLHETETIDAEKDKKTSVNWNGKKEGEDDYMPPGTYAYKIVTDTVLAEGEFQITTEDAPGIVCVDDTLNGNKICDTNTWVPCDTEHLDERIGTHICEDDNNWHIYYANGNDQDNQDDQDGSDTYTGSITKHKAYPKNFNPLVRDTEISFEISADADIEIKIIDDDNKRVLTLVEEELEAGEYTVVWNGTDDTSSTGEVVAPGKYAYVIKAKSPETGNTLDSKSGDIEIIYAVDYEDFETSYTSPAPSDTGSTSGTSTQGQATVIMQEQTSGRTSETGPGVLIYAIFPVVGYFISRRKKSS